jgi:hypothetical protein
MKPDWSKAPEWAKFVAQDENGIWYWYEASPARGYSSWELPELRCELAGSNPHWTMTLDARP